MDSYISTSRTFLTAINPMDELMDCLDELKRAETLPLKDSSYPFRQGDPKPLNPHDLSEPKLRTY